MQIKTFYVLLRNLFLGLNIISLKLILNPKKLIHVLSTQLFFFDTLTNNRKLKSKTPESAFGNEKIFDIKINVDNKGMYPNHNPSYLKDIAVLCYLPKLIKAERIFEIGTHKGYSAFHFAMNSDANTQIFSLDLPRDFDILSLKTTIIDRAIIKDHKNIAESKNYYFSETKYESKIKLLFGDSSQFDYDEYLDNIDLFFIDGAHSYDYVKSDTINALKCVRKGGIICWHDYGRWGVNGVSKWLHELSEKNNNIYSIPGSSIAWMIKE